MTNDDLYDLLVQAFQAGQAWMLLNQSIATTHRHTAALNHADRVLHYLKEREDAVL